MPIGWEWSFLQDQKKHTTEEAYECILWSTVCGFQLNCLLVWWSPPARRANSWRGIIPFLSRTHTITLTNGHVQIGICSMNNEIFIFLLRQLEMEDGDEIDAMLHQTGGTTVSTVFSFVWKQVLVLLFLARKREIYCPSL